MADAQILATQVSAAPLVYTIPGGQEIILKALFASFDGTGAAGAFLPCVRILSDAGKVVGEYVTDSTVAAGSSADVSFAPFLRNAGGATPTPSTVGATAVILGGATYGGSNQIIGGGGSAKASWIAGTFYTSTGDTSVFDFNSGANRIVINKAGMYVAGFVTRFSTTLSRFDIGSEIFWNDSFGGTVWQFKTASGTGAVDQTGVIPAYDGTDTDVVNGFLTYGYGIIDNRTPGGVVVNVFNNRVANFTITERTLFVVQLGSFPVDDATFPAIYP